MCANQIVVCNTHCNTHCNKQCACYQKCTDVWQLTLYPRPTLRTHLCHLKKSQHFNFRTNFPHSSCRGMFGPIICTNQPSAIAVRTSSDTTTHHECCRALQCVKLCVLLCVLHFIWTSVHKKNHQNINMTSIYWIWRQNTKDETRMSIWCLYRSRDRHGCRLGICVWTGMYTSVQQK